MWLYSQWSTNLYRNRLHMGSGYSGRGIGKDNPMLEDFPNMGPIPVGRYRIGKAYHHPRKGPMVMQLTPIGHDAKGRTGFLIHGDSSKHPGDASEGCIVLGPELRRKIAESGDTELEVRR